jgi:galactokinase
MIALCRRAEHEFAGVPCGVMDQTVVVQAQAGHALLLDCRSFAIEHVPFAPGDTCVLVVNTSVRHSLAAGEYAKRRAECDAAAAALGVASLRDASLDAIASAAPVLTRVAGRRARHVVTENARTLAAARALARGDWVELGQLMYASHASLSGDFEVSCRELDAVVAIADRIGTAGGVWGARMTGGGFGGCAVCLVRSDAVPSISARIAADYHAETGRTAVIFPVHAAAGAHVTART